MRGPLSSAIDPTSLFFWLSFASSQVSAALGLASILKNGVARVLGNGGGFDGLCAGQFVLVFFACFYEKNLWLSWIVNLFLRSFFTKMETGFLISSIIAIQLCFCLFSTIGWSKNSARTILKQPTLILLPIFSFFTFAKFSVCCGEKQEARLKLSKRYTVINFVMKTLICIPIAILYLRIQNDLNVIQFQFDVSFYSFNALMTFIFLFCVSSCGCCCSCCVGGQQVIHVYDPDLPDQEFVFRNGEVIRKDQDIELEEK